MSNVTPADEAILMHSGDQKHPKGLRVLFATEMWERFNFYGMRALLTLFLVNSLAMREDTASLIYGGFLGLSYLTPMLGGYISDKYLGNRNCIILGGFVMAIGQLLLFASASTFSSNLSVATSLMWFALVVIIFGNGFFKPNISSMVGQLYPKQQKGKLDSAFTIFYMGINLGALLGQTICPLLGDRKTERIVNGVVESVRNVEAFKWGFLAAGIAMLVGTITFIILKNKYVVTPEGAAIGSRPLRGDAALAADPDEVKADFSNRSVAILLGLLVVFYFIFQYVSYDPNIMIDPKGRGYFYNLAMSPIKTYIYPFIYAAGLSLAVFIMSDKSLTKVEKQRIGVLYIVAFFVIFFWAAFEQAGSSLTFIADNQTDTNILGWNMPPSMVQNFNGLFVIIFAIPFSLLWVWLGRRRAEPISPVKQAIGLFLIALGYFIIAMQVKDLGTTGKLGVIWLIVLYLLHTWGELCLSPIGLSLVAKLAPKRFASLLMGVWFLSNAAGYALTGTLGALLPPTGEKYQAAAKHGIDLGAVLKKTATLSPEQSKFLADEKIPTIFPTFMGFTIETLYDFFMVFVILCGVAAVVLYALTPLLKRMMHGVR
ncbi:MAG: MFS transporter [Chitinophagaceae bacterium]|nr:MAG: MFS transporter [Chitinophagaceae bacterium]